MTARRGAQLALLLMLAAAIVTLPYWMSPYWIRVFTGVMMWAGLALSWNVIGGYAGYISFGHVGFFGIGAYTTALLMIAPRSWPFFATLPVGAVIAAAVAAVAGWPTLRLRGAYFAIATWVLAEAAFQLATVLGFTGGTFGLSLPSLLNDAFFYYVMAGAAVLSYVVIYLLLERFRFGYRVKAVRDDEAAAASMGINTTLVKIEAYALSAAIPAVFGGIDAYWITFINPSSVFGADITDQMVVMTLLGGLGHVWGPALGAAVLFIVNRTFWSTYGSTAGYIAILGAVIALVVLFLPDGLVSLWPRARRLGLVRQMAGMGPARGRRNKRPAPEDEAASSGQRGNDGRWVGKGT